MVVLVGFGGFRGCLLSVCACWSVVDGLVFMSAGGWLRLGFPGLLDFVGYRNMLLG